MDIKWLDDFLSEYNVIDASSDKLQETYEIYHDDNSYIVRCDKVSDIYSLTDGNGRLLAESSSPSNFKEKLIETIGE